MERLRLGGAALAVASLLGGCLLVGRTDLAAERAPTSSDGGATSGDGGSPTTPPSTGGADVGGAPPSSSSATGAGGPSPTCDPPTAVSPWLTSTGVTELVKDAALAPCGDLAFGIAAAFPAINGAVLLTDAAGTKRWRTELPAAPDYIGVDAFGDVFVTGKFHDAFDYGGSHYQVSGDGMFVAGMTSLGDVTWIRVFPLAGTLEQYEMLRGLAVAPSGQIAVLGALAGKVDFGTGVLSGKTGANTAGCDYFFASFDAAGTTRFARQFHGRAFCEDGDVEATPDGDFLVTMAMIQPLDFGAGKLVPLTSHPQLAIGRYAPSGALRWTKVLPDASSVRGAAAGPAIIVYGGNGFADVTDWGTGPFVSWGALVGAIDAADGHVLWARGSPGYFYYQGAVAGDALGNAYLLAPADTTPDFGADAPIEGTGNGVLMGFDIHGAPLFGRAIDYQPLNAVLRSAATGALVVGATVFPPVDLGTGPVDADPSNWNGLLGRLDVPH